jgi:HEAT repeat protein
MLPLSVLLIISTAWTCTLAEAPPKPGQEPEWAFTFTSPDVNLAIERGMDAAFLGRIVEKLPPTARLEKFGFMGQEKTNAIVWGDVGGTRFMMAHGFFPDGESVDGKPVRRVSITIVTPDRKLAASLKVGPVRLTKDRSSFVTSDNPFFFLPRDPKVLVATLKDEDAMLRLQAARGLAWLGPKAGEAVPALTAALKDQDVKVRVQALYALSEVGEPGKAAVPTILELLEPARSEKVEVRNAAVSALVKLQAAKQLVPRLIEGLKKKDEAYAAANALGNIGADALPAVPALIAAMKEPNTAGIAGDALARIGSVPPENVPDLILFLKADMPVYHRRNVARLFAKMGKAAAPAADALRELLKPKDETSVYAAEALWGIGKEPEALTVLEAALDDPKLMIRGPAVRALGRLGPDAKPAIAKLEKLAASDAEPSIRALALTALQAIKAEQKK